MPGAACCVIQPSDIIRGCIDFGIPLHQSLTHIFEHLHTFPLGNSIKQQQQKQFRKV